MKEMPRMLAMSLLLLMFSCKPVCGLEKVRTISIMYLEGPNGISYAHDVLVKAFSKECIDSAFMVNLALRYMDTVKLGQPVGIVNFYSSDKDFIPNEVSQQIDEIDRSCLVKMWFDVKTKNPTTFLFYDDNGENIYWGDKWNAQKKKRQAETEKK